VVVERIAVAWCPQWPVAAAGCGPDEAVVVVHANRVVARSGAAAAAGIRTGHRRREAQARCPHVRVVAHEPERDAREFHRVADAVAAIVPRLELTEPGVVTFAARGPSRYFGGDESMAVRVTELVCEAMGPDTLTAGAPGVGIADGRFAAGVAAHLAARRGAPVVVPPGTAAAFLAPRPLRWLVDVGGVGDELVGLFARLGLRDLGGLAALPAADVLARFGWAGAAAHRMAAAADERPPGAEDPPPGLAHVHHYDVPVQQLDAVVFTGKHLAEQLVRALSSAGRVCTRLLVVAETEHGERSERVWGRGSGLTAAAMVERIRWQLDGWGRDDTDPAGAGDGAGSGPTAGIVQLRVEPLEVRPDDGVQLGLWGGRTQADEWAQRAAARLAGLVGDEAVVVPAWQGGRQPADAYRWVPAALADLGAPDRLAPAGAGEGRGPWPGSLPAPSPAVVLADPVEVGVVGADGATVRVSGRGVVSEAPVELRLPERRERVVAWAGPWPLDERWWEPARTRRVARFQLATADGRAYLATVERQRWWLVAEYA